MTKLFQERNPVADMVFLLLIFFVAAARPGKSGSGGVDMSLPGVVKQSESVEIPDEQIISVKSGGLVVMNELAIGQPGDAKLERLVRILGRFKTAAEANKTRALVTLDVEDGARHQRIVDVLNACARAGISGVAFNEASSDS